MRRLRHRLRLQSRLRSCLAALGLVGVVVVVVNVLTITQWRESEDEQGRHYSRSLRLQEVRALTFEAFKEVPDAVIGLDPDPRDDYERRLAPIDALFEEWVALAEDDAELREVDEVRAAAAELDRRAGEIFDLVDAGRADDAARALEAVEEEAFEPFDEVTSRATAGDRANRQTVQEDAASARRTAFVTLGVAVIGVLSLLLLLAAYLAGGVFGPLRAIRDAVGRLADGEPAPRLPTEGDDEVAQVADGVNRLADRLAAEPAAGAAGEGERPARRSLDLTRFRLAGLLHGVLTAFEDRVVRRSVGTAVSVDPAVALVVADRARLREALVELVRNALDALPDTGGSVQLRARPDPGGGVRIEVEDDGSGLDDDDLARLREGRGPEVGRGAGLRLATALVAEHDGRLQLQALAGGTLARIVLADALDPPPRTTGPTRRPPRSSSAEKESRS